MSALGYTCLLVAALILGVGGAMDVQHPGSLAVMGIMATFPAVVTVLCCIDYWMERTVDQLIARRHLAEIHAQDRAESLLNHHANKNFEDAL